MSPAVIRSEGRRLAVLTLALLGLLAAYLVATVRDAQAAEVVISQGRPTTASSVEWAGTSASAATDGNTGTRWSSVAGTTRYVRLHLTERALPSYGYSLWEFQVFSGTPTAPPGTSTLLSYNKPGAASSEQNDVNCNPCTAGKAFDLDPATRWATSSTTGWVDPGWISVDLGATAQISRVELQWDPAYATAYRIQVSANGSTWTDIYSTTTGKGFKEVLTVTGTGRYVRMYGTARSSAYGYSLYDFNVYGTGGAPTAPPVPPADPVFPATRLVFNDEFNDPAGTRPSTARWTYDPGVPQNGEIQYYTANSDNAQTDGAGSLVIEARREAANGRAYTSARMNTGGKFTVQYGRVEARIKVPKGNGLWPAFWMMGADFLTGRPWPYNGEIDIMEVLGRNTTEGYSTLHAPQYNGGGGYGQRSTPPPAAPTCPRTSTSGPRNGTARGSASCSTALRSSTPARRPSRPPAGRGSSTTRSI